MPLSLDCRAIHSQLFKFVTAEQQAAIIVILQLVKAAAGRFYQLVYHRGGCERRFAISYITIKQVKHSILSRVVMHIECRVSHQTVGVLLKGDNFVFATVKSIIVDDAAATSI